MNKVYINKIIIGVFLNLHKSGNSEILLTSKDMNDYVSKLEHIFSNIGLINSDLFIKTPVEETYDEFKRFLINQLYGNRLAIFNEDYNKLTICCNEYVTNKILNELDEYHGVIELCSNVLLDNVKLQNIKIKKRN